MADSARMPKLSPGQKDCLIAVAFGGMRANKPYSRGGNPSFNLRMSRDPRLAAECPRPAHATSSCLSLLRMDLIALGDSDSCNLTDVCITDAGQVVVDAIGNETLKAAIIQARERAVRLDTSDRANRARMVVEQAEREADESWMRRDEMHEKSFAIHAAEQEIVSLGSRIANGANDLDDLVTQMRAARMRSKTLQAELDREHAEHEVNRRAVADRIEREVRRCVPEAFRPDGTQIVD